MQWLSRIKRLVENLLTSGLKESTEARLIWRVRVLNLTGMLLGCFGVIWTITFFSYRLPVLASCILGLAVGELLILVYYRTTHNFKLSANLTIGVLLLGICVPNWFSGGLVHANVVPFFLVPLIAVTLLGQWGLVWGLVTLIVAGILQYMTLTGYAFPHLLPEGTRDIDMVITWLSAFIVLVILISRYEASRDRAERRIAREKERAEEANRAKGQFLANMSHELRTPMNAIIGLTDLTLGSGLNEEQRRNLQRVKDDAYSLLALLEDVLDVSRIEAGKLELHLEPFNPKVLSSEVIESMRVRADDKQLSLNLTTAESVPELLRGEAGRLRQILINLVDNAVKFTDRGSVEVGLDYTGDGELRLTISDSGIGIPEQSLATIFESFSQVDGSSSRRYRGTGLGLSICKQLTESLGGRIQVESQEGKGSKFVVFLPFGRAESAERSETGGRILAVEDDEISRELVETILRSAGYAVDSENDGTTAVETFGRGVYRLVLMDVQMPGMDGLEAARRIRAGEDPDQRVPIVAITANALNQERERCLDAGMDDFITKPIEPSSLVETVRRWIG